MNDLEKCARTIAGLYNHAMVLGLGAFSAKQGPLPPEEALVYAKEAAEKGSIYFDYLHGRVMKTHVEANGDVQSFRLYDRDNGEGKGAAAVECGLTDPYYDVLRASAR